MHRLFYDRAQRLHPAGISTRRRLKRVRLRHLPGRVSMEFDAARPGDPRAGIPTPEGQDRTREQQSRLFSCTVLTFRGWNSGTWVTWACRVEFHGHTSWQMSQPNTFEPTAGRNSRGMEPLSSIVK